MGSLYGGLHSRPAVFLVLGKNTLPHDNGIVHHNPEDQNKAKERGEIDTDIKPGQEGQGAEEGDRDAQHDKESERGAQEKGQDQEDKDEPEDAIFDEHLQAAGQVIGEVVGGFDFDSRG